MIDFSETNDGVVFGVRVIPRSSRSEIVGEHDGALKIKLASPPVDGAANEELTKLLSRILGIPRSNVEIVAGRTAKSKKVRIPTAAREKMAAILQQKS